MIPTITKQDPSILNTRSTYQLDTVFLLEKI